MVFVQINSIKCISSVNGLFIKRSSDGFVFLEDHLSGNTWITEGILLLLPLRSHAG